MAEVESQSVFWKMFGGGLISLVTLLLSLVLNSLSGSINTYRAEQQQFSSQMREDNVALKEKVIALEQNNHALKERLASQEQTAKATWQVIRSQDKENAKIIAELREKLLRLEAKSVIK